MTEPPRTFAEHVADYAQAGWPCILPVPVADKFPPPVGFTGAEGRDTDPLQLVRWAGSHAHHSIALRMPDGVIGIDVDQYVKKGTQKRGAETLTACVARWGPLPPTWTSTAREPGGPSRIHFYRVPPGRYATKLTGEGTGDVEIIQRHHRYAVVWPSPHQELGSVYRWYDPHGQVVDAPPKPGELPELPPAWVAGLAEGATLPAAASADRASGEALLEALLEDWRPECADMTSARLTAVEKLKSADAGSRHDAMTERTHHLIQLSASGHPGVAHAVLELREAWAQLTAGEDRAEEFERALLTTARKAVTAHGQHQVPRDPCLLTVGGFPMPAPAPAPAGGADGEDEAGTQLAEPPRWASVREIIGAHVFDPNAGTDQSLAEAVLARTYPALRYAYDSGGWLLRAPDRWELHGRLSPWAVATLAPLMPVGDPTADKASEPYARAQRRSRLMSNAGAKAVAGKVDDLVAGGMHPASVELATLDADPELLWAGGVAWDLRASLERPVPADVDPATPHLRTAAVAPERIATPLWDDFLAAVWPDAELRRWAIRVLSIAVTGYSDRALPILLGETGRGKTQVVALMMSVLGAYAHAANSKLLSPNSNEHDTIVFDLKGRRLSFIDEAPSESKAGQERLKQLTGGGELTGRRMNQDSVTWMPTHTFVLTANPESEPVLTDPAVRSRTRLIPCEGDPEQVRLTRAAIGHITGRAWRREAPGVLASMMAEAAGWLAEPTSAHVTAAPEAIRYLAEHLGAEQDPVAMWVAEECEPFEPGTPARDLYQAFTASCLRNNLRRDAIPSETKWGRALTRLGIEKMHSEHGKRRPLRVRSGGFLPGMEPLTSSGGATGQPTGQPMTGNPQTPSQSVAADQLGPNPDQLLTGSQGQLVSEFSQVNPKESVEADQSDQLITNPYTCAGARTRRKAEGENPTNRSADPSASHPGEPAPKPARKTKPRSEEATQRAAEKRAAEREAKITEAAGPVLELPAVVLRDGSVRAAELIDVDALLATITDDPAGELTVDVETTGFPVGHRHYGLRTVQLGGEHFAVVLDPDQAEHADVVRRHLAAAPVLHAHSATADLVPAAMAGLLEHGYEEAWSRMHDTVTPAKLADPASTGSDPGLKKLAAAILGEAALSPRADDARAELFKAGKWLTETKTTTPVERSGWAQVDSRCTTMVRYAAADVLDDAAIARRLPAPPPGVHERERLAQRMTARVALHGLRLDGEQVAALRGQQQAALAEAAEQLGAFGIENPGSDQQVGAAVERLGLELPRTPTGRPSVASGVLEPHAAADGPLGDLIRARLAYQEAENRLGLFLEGYHLAVTQGDGRVRPTVYTMEAKTGRMSCVRPNLQQVPRSGGFRSCITADPGHVLVSADFSSVELRVAAALSQDPEMIRMLAEGIDYHQMVARLVWGPGAGKAERYKAKPMVFGRIYGSGAPGMARQNGVSEATARAVIDAMDHLTPGLTAWSRSVADGVGVGRTQFRTHSGRIVHLPTDRPYAAPNYCIQGTARELLIDALERWSRTRWGGAVLLPVHDELVVQVPEHEAEAATAALVECMTTTLPGVQIVAEASEPSYAWKDSA